jgi:transcriptional regulator with XRE-family HTH domain/tetratricopeptide (TPR) repeat protein
MKPNQRLKHEREQRGWSQSKLAGLVGTNPATIGRWERGISLPYPFHRERLCELYGKDARELGLVEEATMQNDEPEQKPSLPTPAAPFIFDPAIPLPPIEASSLVGRDILLEQLKQQLYAEGTFAVSALHGLPGVGKTALALTLAHDGEVQQHFADGILWVGLGIKPEIQELLGRWSTLLGLAANEITGIKHTDEWARALQALIGRRRMLLILDDVWNIDDALAFLVGGPNCAYIITTRFPQIGMQIAANQFTVVSELSEEDGITLLARFVPTLVKQDAATAQRLVQSVGALPLALVLVGKYLRSQAYNEQPRRLRSAISYVSTIEQRFDLSEPLRPAQPHPSLHDGTPLSLRSLIALSTTRLDEQAREMLRALAVFPTKPESFSEQAATAISALPVETLDRLCDAGLLESSGPERYMLHQTIADYARMQIEGHETTLYRRLVEYMVGYVEEHEHDYDALALEQHSISIVLEEAYSRVMPVEYVRGVCALAPFLCIRGRYDQARRHLQQAEQVMQCIQAPRDPDRIAKILFYLGHLATLQSEYALAETYLQRSLQYTNQAQQGYLFLTCLGALVAKRGDYARAENYLQEAIRLARGLEEPEVICQALTELGHVMIRKGNYERAAILLQEGLDLANQLDYKKQRSHLLTELGMIAENKENHTQAYSYFRETDQV